MFGSPKHLVIASTLLLGGLPLLAAEKTTRIAPVTGLIAVVKCPGLNSIPLTADQEQGLPLRVIGSLTCGETVAVLADNEGYTALIRTREGREGYVARMYLTTEVGAHERKPVASVATPENGVVRWEAGAPGCDEFMSYGRYVESISAKGITVQVSLEDSGWKYRVNVAVSNQRTGNVQVQPEIVSLDELEPSLKPMPPVATRRVAHATTHQVMWTIADALASPGAVAPQAAGISLDQRLAYRTSSTPDFMNPNMALNSARPPIFARSESVDLEAISLKTVSLASGQNIAGMLWFERDASARELSLRVPVGDMIFDFAFSLEQKN
jgi:hypothetical protein